jgi:hypothetical protein
MELLVVIGDIDAPAILKWDLGIDDKVETTRKKVERGFCV